LNTTGTPDLSKVPKEKADTIHEKAAESIKNLVKDQEKKVIVDSWSSFLNSAVVVLLQYTLKTDPAFQSLLNSWLKLWEEDQRIAYQTIYDELHKKADSPEALELMEKLNLKEMLESKNEAVIKNTVKRARMLFDETRPDSNGVHPKDLQGEHS